MNYIELNIPVADPTTSEVLVAELAELPFDSFEEEPGLLKAYIPADKLPDCKAVSDDILATHGIEGARYIEIETQNWNAVWESHFEPVNIDDKLVIRAPFHAPISNSFRVKNGQMQGLQSDEQGSVLDVRDRVKNEHNAAGGRFSREIREIIIMPKMSFGTGHHATTSLMCAEMLEHDFGGKRVLDMGSGTGVLAILAAQLGAESVVAVDIDEWAYENSLENIAANGVGDIVHSIRGDVSAIAGRRFDVVLANINKNILLRDMHSYVDCLSAGGLLIMSGIFESDIPAVERCALDLGLHHAGQRIKDNWACIVFRS